MTRDWRYGYGLVAEVLARDFTFGVLTHLADGPRTPLEIARHLERARPRARDLVRPPTLTHGALYDPLHAMVRDRLLDATTDRHAFPRTASYRLTPVAAELVAADGPLAGFGARHYRHLLDVSLARDGLDRSALTDQDPGEDAGLRARRGAGFALALVRKRRFCYAMLVTLDSMGCATTADWAGRVRAGLLRNPVPAGTWTLNDTQFYRNLHWLTGCGCVATRQERAAGRRRTWAWVPPLGQEYLAALRPLGDCALRHRDELVPALKQRRGITANR